MTQNSTSDAYTKLTSAVARALMEYSVDGPRELVLNFFNELGRQVPSLFQAPFSTDQRSNTDAINVPTPASNQPTTHEEGLPTNDSSVSDGRQANNVLEFLNEISSRYGTVQNLQFDSKGSVLSFDSNSVGFIYNGWSLGLSSGSLHDEVSLEHGISERHFAYIDAFTEAAKARNAAQL